jgi:hypothetical protein
LEYSMRGGTRVLQSGAAVPPIKESTMISGIGQSKILARTLCVAVALSVPLLAPNGAAAEEHFGGPTFRKGMWHFVRTLEIVTHRNVRHKLFKREMTRCVDPTQAMKATFSSASIGNCHSSRPEKISNKYVFSNRCDYMGPVSTVITVLSDEAYTEVNEVRVGQVPRTDLVIARRISDCDSASRDPAAGEIKQRPTASERKERTTLALAGDAMHVTADLSSDSTEICDPRDGFACDEPGVADGDTAGQDR